MEFMLAFLGVVLTLWALGEFGISALLPLIAVGAGIVLLYKLITAKWVKKETGKNRFVSIAVLGATAYLALYAITLVTLLVWTKPLLGFAIATIVFLIPPVVLWNSWIAKSVHKIPTMHIAATTLWGARLVEVTEAKDVGRIKRWLASLMPEYLSPGLHFVFWPYGYILIDLKKEDKFEVAILVRTPDNVLFTCRFTLIFRVHPEYANEFIEFKHGMEGIKDTLRSAIAGKLTPWVKSKNGGLENPDELSEYLTDEQIEAIEDLGDLEQVLPHLTKEQERIMRGPKTWEELLEQVDEIRKRAIFGIVQTMAGKLSKGDRAKYRADIEAGTSVPIKSFGIEILNVIAKEPELVDKETERAAAREATEILNQRAELKRIETDQKVALKAGEPMTDTIDPNEIKKSKKKQEIYDRMLQKRVEERLISEGHGEVIRISGESTGSLDGLGDKLIAALRSRPSPKGRPSNQGGEDSDESKKKGDK